MPTQNILKIILFHLTRRLVNQLPIWLVLVLFVLVIGLMYWVG
jgi:hypothetical protein